MALSMSSAAMSYVSVVPAAAANVRATVSMSAANFEKFVNGNKADTTLVKPWTSGEIQVRLATTRPIDR